MIRWGRRHVLEDIWGCGFGHFDEEQNSNVCGMYVRIVRRRGTLLEDINIMRKLFVGSMITLFGSILKK